MFRIFFIALMVSLHPVHVTLLSLEYSAEDEIFIGFLKVYYDDFLLDYGSLFGKNPDTEINKDRLSGRKLIEGYLNERVNLYAGKNKLDPQIVDFSLKDNELRLEIKFEKAKKAKEFTVTNSILADIYSDQSNLLIFRYGNFEEGVKLTPEKREQVFKVK